MSTDGQKRLASVIDAIEQREREQAERALERASGCAAALRGLGLSELEELEAEASERLARVRSALEQRRESERQCNVCMVAAKDTVFDPCGHFTCGECAEKLQLCPTCREPISKRIKAYS